MAEMLEVARAAYEPLTGPDLKFLPASLGGTAPTLEEATRLDREEAAERIRKRKEERARKAASEAAEAARSEGLTPPGSLPAMARQARQRVPEGPTPDPAVQKLRIRYTKRGRLRFTSSRDFQRALERALRRADVPMAFSAGFHPHPKISYANAASTGTASEAEYFEISVTQRVDPDSVRVALDEALPPGIDVITVVEAAPGALADRLEASDWLLEFGAMDVRALRAAVDALLARDTAEVTRMTKSGPRTFDVRGAVLTRHRAVSGGVALRPRRHGLAARA